MKKADIHKLNQIVPIEKALGLINIDVPENADSWKTFCPTGYEHRDGGTSKTLRVYLDTNSAWCFSCKKSFRPIDIAEIFFKNKPATAGDKLAKHLNLTMQEPTLDERWGRLDASTVKILDLGILTNSLIEYLRTLPRYIELQFDDEVISKVTELIDLLEEIPEGSEYDTIEKVLGESKKSFEEFWTEYEGSTK